MKGKLTLAQNTLFNTAGSCFYLVCQYLITVLAVRLGSVESGGVLSLAMSVTNVFFTLSTFGIRTFQVSDYDRKYSYDTYVTTRLMTCGTGFILCAAYSVLNPAHTGYEAACIIVYMVFRMGEALSDENQALQQSAERMDWVCWSFILRGALLAGPFAAVLAATGDLLKALGAVSLCTMLAVLFFEFPVSRRLTGFRLHFSLRTSLKLLAENWPLMANSLLMAFLVTIPRTRLDALQGSWWMGIYGSVAAPAAIVQSAALWLFTPSLTAFARHFGEKDRDGFFRLHHRILLLLAGVTAAILAGAAVLGRWGLGLLYGDEVAAHSYLLLPTLVTTALIAGEYYLSSLLTVVRDLKTIVISNGAAAALTLAVSDALIGRFGAEGVNMTICASMALNLVIQYAALRRALNRRFGQNGK